LQTDSITHARNSVGIAILWIMPSFVYFLKELFGFSGTPLFSGLFNVLGLLLMLNRSSLKVAFKTNPVLSFWGLSLFLLTVLYFFVFNSHPPSFYLELINLSVVAAYFILLLRINNEAQSYLIWIIFLATFLINIILIYSISSNPDFVMGARATVQFKRQGNSDYSGNPYVYSRNGLFGFVISLLMIHMKPVLVKSYSFFTRLLLHINLWISLIVIIITQTRATFLALAIILVLAFVFVFKLNRQFFSPSKSAYFFYGLIALMINYIDNRFHIIETISGYYSNYAALIERAVLTGTKLGKVSEQDASAMGRVRNIEYFSLEWRQNTYEFIFGHGYRFKYMDIPVLESFLNFGILGLLLFLGLQVALIYYAIKSLRSGLLFQTFLGLIYFHTFISIFTSGRPTDLPYWVSYFIFIRFLGVFHEQKIQKI
jgi:hypothetical protein